MNLIVAVDNKWGIGKNNRLLFSIPLDMKYFKAMTTNKVVVMGYNTLLSFPQSKPLPNRTNVVLAPLDVTRDDLTVVHTLDDLFKQLSNYDDDDVFIIGGGMFYKTMLPYCKNAYVTQIFADGCAEVFFENLDNNPNWTKTLLDQIKEYNNLKFQFTLYENKNPLNYKMD